VYKFIYNEVTPPPILPAFRVHFSPHASFDPRRAGFLFFWSPSNTFTSSYTNCKKFLPPRSQEIPNEKKKRQHIFRRLFFPLGRFNLCQSPLPVLCRTAVHFPLVPQRPSRDCDRSLSQKLKFQLYLRGDDARSFGTQESGTFAMPPLYR